MSGKVGQRSRYKTKLPPTFTFKRSYLERMDRRCQIARDLRDRLTLLVESLGGIENLSYQGQSLCERFVFLETWLEGKEQAFLSGEPLDESLYLSGLTTFNGLFKRLGIERKTKPVYDLAQQFAAHQETENPLVRISRATPTPESPEPHHPDSPLTDSEP